VNPDAHVADGYSDVRYGIGAARKGMAHEARRREHPLRGRSAPALPGAPGVTRRARGATVAKGRTRRAGKTKTGEVRIYPNDPESTVGVVPATPLPRSPGDPAFVIEGRRYAPAPYEPGTLAFQYWQGEVALGRAIRVWRTSSSGISAHGRTGNLFRVKLGPERT
jgi:hypothetical protein